MDNIYNDGTKDCFVFVGDRKDIWHRKGTSVVGAMTMKEVVKLAGLDWQAIKVPNWIRLPQVGGKGPVVESGSYSVVRSSDNAILANNLGPGFVVLQNEELLNHLDALVECNGGAHYDTAGALGNGSRIFASIRIPKADITIPGEPNHQAYLIGATAHDGSLATLTKISITRPVCQNTLFAALKGAGAVLKIKHTKSAQSRLATAREMMTGVIQDAKQLEVKLNALATRKMTQKSFIAVLDKLFPGAENEELTTRRKNTLIQIAELYASNDHDANKVIKGTALNMLNAVTEFADHYRGVRITDSRAGMSEQSVRAENAMLDGSGAKLKDRALAVIESITEDAANTHEPFDALVVDPMNDAQFAKFMKDLGA